MRRNDLPECDYHRQEFEFELASTDTLAVPELFEVPILTNASEGEWRFRPEVRWMNLPEEAASVSGFVSIYGDSSSTSWSLRPGACERDTATWPALLDDVEAESNGYISMFYWDQDRSSSCSSFFSFPSL